MTNTHKRRARWLRAGLGVALSALLHVLLIGTVFFGPGGKHSPSHPREGLGANAIASTEEALATLILIEEPGVGPHEEEDSPEKLASHGLVLQNFRLTIVSPEPTIDAAVDVDASTDEKATAAESNGDRQMQAALFGRYIGQIQARVERAWLRPRTPIGAELFECRVQVLQNKRGGVLEITLQRCNGDVSWALSLVHAIERASPLPAPPDPAVFAQTLQLSFHSAALTPGGDEEGFEPRASLTANTPR